MLARERHRAVANMEVGLGGLVGAELAGYRIERLLGRGGMGVVYLAEDLRLKRKVALKLLSPVLAEDDDFRARFLHESEIAASLDHPNIVPIYEAGEIEGRLFIAMRYVEGTDLKKQLRQGALSPEEAVNLLAQVAAALDAAHARGLVHRDVKPSNVLVAPGLGHEGADHAYLADFGLTKDLSDQGALAEDGQLMATIDYVAPEQIAGGEFDHRADVYSLGCLFYECLTGEPPFPHESELAVLFAHLEEGPPAPSERRLELPEAIDPVVATALAKSPDERHRSCRELMGAAREALGLAEPVRSRWLRGPALLGIAGLAVLSVGLAAFLLARGAGTPTLESAPPNSLALLDPRSGAILAATDVGSRPGDVAATEDAVWIVSPDEQRVLRIDAETRSVVDEIPVGFDPAAVAVGLGAIWVAENGGPTLARISPEEGEIVQTIRIGAGPTDVAVGDEAVWVTNRLDDSVQRIEPDASNPVTDTIPVGDEPTAIAIGEGAVWVASPATSFVYQVDLDTRAVTRTIPVGNGASDLALVGDEVWVANSLDGTISIIDVESGAVATIRAGEGPASIVAAGDSVWIADELDGKLLEINAGKRAVERVVELGASPHRVALVGGALWTGVHGTATGHRGGTLKVVTPGAFPISIDPAFAYDPLTAQVMTVTNDGLIDFRRVGGAGGASLVPNLAVDLPKRSDAGTTYAFRLRDGIRYSTGEAVRAQDFRRAIERVFAIPTTPSFTRSFFSGLKGADACVAKSTACDLSRGIVTDDARGSVTFHLSAPDPEFLYKLALTAAYPVPAGTPDRDVGATPVPATGPYMIEEYVSGKRLTLVPNPHFRVWSRAAQPDGNADRISFTIGVPAGDAVTAVAEGRADYLMSLRPPSRLLAGITARYASQVHRVSEPSTLFLVLNTRAPPFNDVRIRQALNYAIDRAAVVDAFGGPAHATATCQVLPPNFPGYVPYCPYTATPGEGQSWTGPDLEKARALVKESGSTGMRVRVFAWADETEWVLAAREAVAALDRLGYRASLRKLDVDVDTYFATISDSRNKVQVAFSGWQQDYPAAGGFIAGGLSCKAFVPGDGSRNSNFSGFCDPAIDAKIERGRRLQVKDPARANEVFAEVDHELVDRAPYVFLVNPVAIDFVSARVGNVQHHPQWRLLLDQLWVR
jgi:YVTN family beta-propeller protein